MFCKKDINDIFNKTAKSLIKVEWSDHMMIKLHFPESGGEQRTYMKAND